MDFVYHNPRNLEQLFNIVNGTGNCTLFAGGTDLLVKMKKKLIEPENIVDLKGIDDLKGIVPEGEFLNIKPLVTHDEIENSEIIKKKAYVIAEAAAQVGSPQIRNMGTVGGNIGNASPAADIVPALLVLDAKVEMQSIQGQEEKELLSVFKGPGQLSIKKGQVISNIKARVLAEQEGAAFMKSGQRKALAISVINGAVWLKVNGNKIEDVRIALGAVAPTPIRLFDVEKWLIGREANEDVFKKAGEMAKEVVKPIDDIRSSAEYRKTVSAAIVYNGLKTALQRIGGLSQ